MADDRPDCDLCPDDTPSDYFDPDTDAHLCKQHAIATGALTGGGKVWLWNDRRKFWDRG